MSFTSPLLQSAQSFMWHNARLLDRHLFTYLFAGGAREPVLAALRAYQNGDGGFGHALEPDIRCPESQPAPTEIGLEVLDLIGWDDLLAARACDFLQSISTNEGGVPWVLPSVRNYPRAPWWQTDDNPPASIISTGATVGLMLKHGVTHPWVAGATAYCWRTIEESPLTDVHSLLRAVAFLEHAPDRERAAHAFTKVADQAFAQGFVAIDTDAKGYVSKVLEWAPTPASLFRARFTDDQVAAHLDALVQGQQADGGWNITWPAISPACEQEWRGWRTILALRTLEAYGRL